MPATALELAPASKAAFKYPKRDGSIQCVQAIYLGRQEVERKARRSYSTSQRIMRSASGLRPEPLIGCYANATFPSNAERRRKPTARLPVDCPSASAPSVQRRSAAPEAARLSHNQWYPLENPVAWGSWREKSRSQARISIESELSSRRLSVHALVREGQEPLERIVQIPVTMPCTGTCSRRRATYAPSGYSGSWTRPTASSSKICSPRSNSLFNQNERRASCPCLGNDAMPIPAGQGAASDPIPISLPQYSPRDRLRYTKDNLD